MKFHLIFLALIFLIIPKSGFGNESKSEVSSYRSPSSNRVFKSIWKGIKFGVYKAPKKLIWGGAKFVKRKINGQIVYVPKWLSKVVKRIHTESLFVGIYTLIRVTEGLDYAIIGVDYSYKGVRFVLRKISGGWILVPDQGSCEFNNCNPSPDDCLKNRFPECPFEDLS